MTTEGKSPHMDQPEKPASASTPTQPAVAPPAIISIEEFQRLALRIGRITAAQEHPNADRLLVLTVDIGEPTPRQVVAGIRKSYQAAELIGKHVVVVSNLKPAMLRGIESQGMVLATSDDAGIVLVAPERAIVAGSTVK